MRDYIKLGVWKKAHELYMLVKNAIIPKFPQKGRFEWASQLSRASLSVPLNIVEGCGRLTDKDFAHFPDNSPGLRMRWITVVLPRLNVNIYLWKNIVL